MIIRAITESWRARWSSLKQIALLPQMPAMDGDIAQLSHLAGEVWDRTETADRDALTVLLASLTPVRDDYDTHATQQLFVPGFREDFQQMWDEAGRAA